MRSVNGIKKSKYLNFQKQTLKNAEHFRTLQEMEKLTFCLPKCQNGGWEGVKLKSVKEHF